MKTLLIIFLLFVSGFTYGQTDTSYVKVPKTEMIKLAQTINRQIERDSLQVIQIKNLKRQILNYEQIQKQDSLLLMYRDYRINLYTEEIELYDKRMLYLEKSNDSWVKKPVLWFVLGIGTAYIASEIVSNVK